MKLLHLADLHGNRERADDLLKSLSVARRAAQGVDLIAIAGDTWDATMQNTEGSRFPEIVEAIRALADVAPVVMIYGTPTHDVAGSLEIFRTLSSKFGITILEPGKAYALAEIHKGSLEVCNLDPNFCTTAPGYMKGILFGVPEPSKRWIMPLVESKDAAEATVRDGLRSLFTGLGSIRRQYPTLPCVMLYHGQVGGARLQNGDILDNGSGIRPSVDDLAAVCADYIAMGDIHEPQQVGASIGLPAYYPGSAYPIDFGETHEAGANLVELNRVPGSERFVEFSHTVTRVPFGHPVNRKISKRYPASIVPDDIVPGARTWLEITCTKEESPLITFDSEALTSMGAAPGSRVTLNVLPTETVRAAAITEKVTAEDKVAVWFEQSKKDFTPELRAKVREVEAEARAAGAVGTGGRIQLNRLVLRGAIGLWKKSGLEEVDFNLDEIEPGLVALIGQNGAGKTTLLENMHPWPALLTRDGTLKDHFRGRDACRDLYWTDADTGYRYRALITINAAVASGTTEYYLYRDTGAGFEPVVGITGRKDDYVAEIDRLFGSQDLFLRSAFVTQRQPKGVNDLADATPKERKTLFTQLCGIDHWETFKAMAKTQGDEIEAQARTKEAEIAVLTARLPDETALVAEKNQAEADLEDARGDLNALGELGKVQAARADALGADAKANADRARQAAEAGALVRDAETKAQQTRQNIEAAKTVIARKPAAEKAIAEFEELSAQVATEEAAYRKHLEALADHQKVVDAARAEYDQKRREHDAGEQAKLSSHQEMLKEMTRGMDEVLRKYSASRDVQVRLEHRIEHLEAQLKTPVAENCPTCGQILPANALEPVRASRAQIQADLDEARNLISAASVTTKELDEQYSAAKHSRDAFAAPASVPFPAFTPPASTVPVFDLARLNGLKADLDFLNVNQARADLNAAGAAQARIEELSKALMDLDATAKRERIRESELRAGLRPEIAEEHARAVRALEHTRELYRQAQGREAQASAALSQAVRALDSLSKDRQQVDALKTALAGLQAQVAEWRLLELAFSDKGVQALELDAVAPSIAAIANGLLRDAFGTRYQIEFNTTRMGGTGARQRQIEDFLINILDSETGDTQELSTLSGGETVWIRRALYDAFGIIRARNTRLQFLTVFQDEADGALDPAARLTYLRMLESAHRQAGRRHTLIITHSEALQELIQARVEVAKLKARQGEAVAA